MTNSHIFNRSKHVSFTMIDTIFNKICISKQYLYIYFFIDKQNYELNLSYQRIYSIRLTFIFTEAFNISFTEFFINISFYNV